MLPECTILLDMHTGINYCEKTSVQESILTTQIFKFRILYRSETEIHIVQNEARHNQQSLKNSYVFIKATAQRNRKA